MILLIIYNTPNMKLVCPECKNEVNLTSYPNLDKDSVVECDVCGITLLVVELQKDTDKVVAEVVDEGK